MNHHAPDHFAPRFWWVWSGQAVSLLGSLAVQFALIWWLTLETQSATILATATLVAMLPQVVLGPVVGAMVDRWNRKLIMFLADVFIAAASVALAWMFWTGSATVAHVFVILAVRSLGGVFHASAMMASTSLMVPEDNYVRIQGLNQTMQSGSPLLAAPIGAALVSTLSMHTVMLVDLLTAAIAIAPLLVTPIPQPQKDSDGAPSPGIWDDVVAGFSYLLRHRSQLHLVLAAAFVNLCIVPAFALLPLFVLQEMNGDAYRLGWLEMIFGVGGVAGGTLLATWGGFKKRIRTAALGFALLGAGTFAFGFTGADTFAWGLAAMSLVGVAAALINGSIAAVMQSLVPADYQGRIFTLLGSIAAGMAPLGLLLAAPIAETLGVRFWYLVAGVACVAVAGVVPAISVTDEFEATSAGEGGRAAEPTLRSEAVNM